MRSAGARMRQPEVVVDLGDRADRGPWIAAGRFLVDGDRRRQTFDEVHVRLVHLTEKLPCICGERLDVAALALGEDGVEGETRLPDPDRPVNTISASRGRSSEMFCRLCSRANDETVGHGAHRMCRR